MKVKIGIIFVTLILVFSGASFNQETAPM